MKEKKFKESKPFKVFKNYGVLAAEKCDVYTYGGEHPHATTSDELDVFLPANDIFGIYETTFGTLAVESAWEWNYDFNDVLQGDKKPCFYAVDKDGKGHRVFLEEISV